MMLLASCSDFDPCQLVWQVKQFERLARRCPQPFPFPLFAASGGEEGKRNNGGSLVPQIAIEGTPRGDFA